MHDDTLSIMLDHLGVRGTVFCRAELAAPWAVETRGTPTAIFHVIVSGSGYVRLADGPPRAWRAGDLLLFNAHNAAHAVRGINNVFVRPKTVSLLGSLLIGHMIASRLKNHGGREDRDA